MTARFIEKYFPFRVQNAHDDQFVRLVGGVACGDFVVLGPGNLSNPVCAADFISAGRARELAGFKNGIVFARAGFIHSQKPATARAENERIRGRLAMYHWMTEDDLPPKKP